MKTEYEFTLPNGYLDASGTLHRQGIMRLATAMDEIKFLNDLRVRQNPSYLTILILSEVILRLGTLTEITPALIESLFAMDMAFLNNLYERINSLEEQSIEAVCPQCGCHHQVPLNFTKRD